LRLGNETENVVWLRCVGSGGNRFLQLFLRGRQVRHVEECDAEIDARDREAGFELQRTSK